MIAFDLGVWVGWHNYVLLFLMMFVCFCMPVHNGL
jgi:hypothetical protein